MKTLAMLTLLFISACFANAQTKTDSLEYELTYMRYNIGSYHSHLVNGMLVIAGGSVISSIGILAITPGINLETGKTDYTGRIILCGVGGIVSIIGCIMIVDSYKYLKRASIQPTDYGLSMLYRF